MKTVMNMMRIALGSLALVLVCRSGFAADTKTIDSKIVSLANVAGNAMIEVCGTAVESSGAIPLIVTVIHGGAETSTVSNAKGNWCALVRRRNFSGTLDVRVTTLDGRSESAAPLEVAISSR